MCREGDGRGIERLVFQVSTWVGGRTEPLDYRGQQNQVTSVRKQSGVGEIRFGDSKGTACCFLILFSERSKWTGSFSWDSFLLPRAFEQ